MHADWTNRAPDNRIMNRLYCYVDEARRDWICLVPLFPVSSLHQYELQDWRYELGNLVEHRGWRITQQEYDFIVELSSLEVQELVDTVFSKTTAIGAELEQMQEPKL